MFWFCMVHALQKCSRVACVVVVLLSTTFFVEAQSISDVKAASRAAKVTPDLLNNVLNNGAPTPSVLGRGEDFRNEYTIKENRIAIEAIAIDQNGQALLAQLQTLGLTEGNAYRSTVFGFLPLEKLADLTNVPTLNYARPYYKPFTNAGLVTSQGDKALKADLARQTYNVTGTGSKVGILSDSYNALGGASAGMVSGDLPANVTILDDFPTGSDEGRAMAEIVHDVAPGAGIAFNTAYRGQAGFAKGIIDLANAGCTIIVDDIIYLTEPFFQDGIIGQAIDQVVLNNNVAYFSAAGNLARSSYQTTFKNSGINLYGYGIAHDFGGGDVFQKITVPSGGTLRLVLQWDDPFRSVSGGVGAKTDLDIFFFKNGILVGGSAIDNIAYGDPIEVTGTYANNTSTPADIDVVIVKNAGPDPGFIKWINFGSYTITTEYDTRSGSSFGHSGSARAIAVGAAPYFNTPAYNPTLSTAVIEPFSSAGGTPIFFDGAGQRISQDGVVRQKPDITAVDGGNTTFFTTDYEPDGFPNFFGTSAAAPHAAAVAALMQEKASKTLSPTAIASILKQTAIDMDDPVTPYFDTGFDFGTGYGFIQADKAVQAAGPGDRLAITSFTCNSSNSILTSVDFVVGYSTGTFSPSVAPLFINGVTGVGQLGVKYNYPFDTNQNTLAIQDAASRSTYFVWSFREACANTSTPNRPPIFTGVTSLTGVLGVAFRYNVPASSFSDPEGLPLTYAINGLPSGLTFDAASNVISGIPTVTSVNSVTITATDAGGLTAVGTFSITINKTIDQPQSPASLTVTSFTCHTASSGMSSVDFVVGYTDGSFTPSVPALFINGVTGAGKLGVQYTYYHDANQYNLPIHDAATRSTYFVWNFREACGSSPVANRPPVYNGGLIDQTGTVGLPFTYTIPATAFTDPDGQTSLIYTASNLPAGLAFGATSRIISGTPIAVGSRTVTITATDASGAFSTGAFTITIGTTPPATFAIIGSTTVACERISSTERWLTFTPQYSGTNGQAITFSVINESLPTNSPGPYSLRLYTDNPTITLRAEQAGTVGPVTYQYNWLAACNANARRSAEDRQTDLDVTVLSNPVLDSRVEVDVRGAFGESLTLQIADEQGRIVSRHLVSQAAEVERQSLTLNHARGVFLLTVSTPTQIKTLRIVTGQ